MMFLYITCILMAVAGIAPVQSGQEDVLAKSNGVFSVKFYDIVNKPNTNLLISPLSLNYALTAVSLGADGNTLSQIRSALNQPDDKKAIISSYRAYTDNVKNDTILSTATKMYVDKEFKIKDEFKNELTKDFDADVDNIDFGKPEEARVIINKYVDNRTHHLIPELFEKGTISTGTSAVLVNAVHFKADWEHAFNVKDTKKRKFYGIDNEHEVDMMYLADQTFNYLDSDELDAQLIELPYKGGYSFLVILPKEKTGITELEKKIKSKVNDPNASPFIDIFKDTFEVKVDVYLPKFKFEQFHDLTDSLKKLGVIDAFSGAANFSNMSDTRVKIEKVIQKTFIRVDEVGTEAAAATGIIIGITSIGEPVIEFKADHPFIYIIEDKKTQSPVFLGRYNQP